MAGYNHATFVGNLTKDPKMRQAGDKDVCGFRVAVNNPRDKDNPLYVSVSVWGKQGDACEKYLRKGDPVLVSGPISLRVWESDNGPRTDLEIDARETQFLAQRKRDDGDRDRGGRGRDRDREPGPDKSRERESYERQTRGRGEREPDDDIPF